ncbi:Ger(x)C family spore germination protein [Terrihalobacillus insolitus]|uniref:Ger(x)C family spore germination protein n=1 Tax=Terrihalobacillus insolitus TaxID=2950438 RepID=UPI00234176A3|nr:Ger(x)C family spore germination protein [Terrihalobacillus insolitus]MDC3412930.1 Ger(x)C family spore germination protein [Terrihalobacillus insolitus]
MNNKLKRYIIKSMLIISSLLLLSGCWDVKDIDNRMIAVVLGIKSAEDDNIEVFIKFPKPETMMKGSSAGGSDETPFIVIHETAPTVFAAINKINLKLPKSLDLKSIQTVIVDEELAKKGLLPYLEFIIRSRMVPVDANFAVIRGEFSPLFYSKAQTGDSSGMLFTNFFDESAGGSPQKTNIEMWEIYSRLSNPLVSALAPVIQANKQQDTLFTVEGNGYFLGDQMVGLLPQEYMLSYSILSRKIKGNEIIVVDKADVKIIKNDIEYTKMGLNSYGKPFVHLKVSLDLNLVDSSKLNKISKDELENKVSAIVEKTANEIIKQTKPIGADVFQFGNRFRGIINADQYGQWPSLYKDMEIKIEIQSHLRNTGMLKF